MSGWSCELGRYREHDCSAPLACLREAVAALDRSQLLQRDVDAALSEAERADARIRAAGGLLELGVWPAFVGSVDVSTVDGPPTRLVMVDGRLVAEVVVEADASGFVDAVERFEAAARPYSVRLAELGG